MKCPKCRYVSHDYLDACRKCNTDLVAFKRKFNLMVLKPGDLDLGILVGGGREDVSDRARFSVEDATAETPPGKFYIGLDELTAATEIDIQFDPDASNPSIEPGELTKTFYIPEVLARQSSDVNPPDHEAGLDELTAATEAEMQLDPATPNPSSKVGELTKMFYVGLDELTAATGAEMQCDPATPNPLAEKTTHHSNAALAGTVSSANLEPPAEYAPPSPVPEMDMSVGNLDDGFDAAEDIQLDTTEIDRDIDFAHHLPSTAEMESALDYNAAETEENTPGLVLEITDDVPSRSEESNAAIETGRMSDPEVREDGRKSNDVEHAA
jgi:hypothetical protein